MKVTCSHCGEEVLGAVNRCWSCQRELDAAQCDTPKVRRPAIPEFLVDCQNEQEVTHEQLQQLIPGQVVPNQPVRFGSPFALAAHASHEIQGPEAVEVQMTQHRAIAGAISSVLLGGLAVLIDLAAIYRPWWLLLFVAPTALPGLGLGIWGLTSNRQRLAAVGILTCCIAISLAAIVFAWRVRG